MQELQQALRNVDTARNAFVNSDSTDDDVLRERYDAWRDAHNSLSESIKAADSTTPTDSDATDSTDTTATPAPVETAAESPVSPVAVAPTADTPPATVSGTDIPPNLGQDQ